MINDTLKQIEEKIGQKWAYESTGLSEIANLSTNIDKE